MGCIGVLSERGLRLTPQRRLIVDILHDTKVHLTPDEIIAHVQARMPGVNKSTVYRTLELLEKASCVFRSELDGKIIYHHAEEGHHHHLVCSKCGKTIDCDEDLFAPVEQLLKDKYGFRVGFKHMVISGLCEKCRAKNS